MTLQEAAITLAEISITLRQRYPKVMEEILDLIDLSDEGFEEALDSANL